MPGFDHNPVMVAEVLAALKPAAGRRYVDGTIGGAGHAEAILSASSPSGWLFGCDRDGVAVEAARARLARFGSRVELRRGNFAELGEWVELGSCDGLVLDLGVSSPQLDRPARGFSFQSDGPLDMRMDDRQSGDAASLVNELDPAALAEIFFKLGGERRSRQIARAIEKERASRPFRTTRDLAGLVERICPRRPGDRIHPATRVFQALRMAVNEELESLERGLEAGLGILKAGGRLAVITFHSAEDRLVKQFGRRWSRDYVAGGDADIPELRQPAEPKLKVVNAKAIQPAETEMKANPRSRSAQLRIFEKI